MLNNALRDVKTKMLNIFNTKMAIEVTKGQIWSDTIYQKIDVTRSTICEENFILVSKSAH